MNNPTCFFCQQITDDSTQIFLENNFGYARWDDFPVSPGHCEIIPKTHIASAFNLLPDQLTQLYSLINEAKNKIDQTFNPQSYNIGINEGETAGQTIPHLHIHLIPRYQGDVENPRGGIRNIIPGKGNY